MNEKRLRAAFGLSGEPLRRCAARAARSPAFRSGLERLAKAAPRGAALARAQVLIRRAVGRWYDNYVPQTAELTDEEFVARVVELETGLR